MTTAAVSYQDVCEAMATAVDALRAGDLQTAITEATAAQALYSLLPSGGRGFAGGNQNLQWDAQRIDQFLTRLQRQLNASRGVQESKVILVRPTPEYSSDWAYGSQGGW